MTSPAARLRPPIATRNGSGASPPDVAVRRALVLVAEAGRDEARATLDALGYAPEVAADPYAAVGRLAEGVDAFGLLVVSLAAVFEEELVLIETVKQRLGPVEVAVCDVDGRGAAFAEAMRLGADALLAGGMLHRFATPPAAKFMSPPDRPPDRPPDPADVDAAGVHGDPDPALTPAELRALLGDD